LFLQKERIGIRAGHGKTRITGHIFCDLELPGFSEGNGLIKSLKKYPSRPFRIADRISDRLVDVVMGKRSISDLFRLIHVPDFTGTFVADHTGPDGCPRMADFRKQLAIRRLGDSPEDLIADTGSMFGDMFKRYTKFFLCIVLFKLLLQP